VQLKVFKPKRLAGITADWEEKASVSLA